MSGQARTSAASSSPLLELVRLRETLRREPAGLGAVGDPVPQVLLGDRPGASGGVPPGQAFLELEDLRVGNAAVLVALKAHALAARHFGHLLDGEDQELAVLADDRNVVALGLGADDRLMGRVESEHALAFAGVGDRLVGRRHEAAAVAADDEEL